MTSDKSSPELDMSQFTLSGSSTSSLKALKARYEHDRVLLRLESSDSVAVHKHLVAQENIDASIALIDYLLETSLTNRLTNLTNNDHD